MKKVIILAIICILLPVFTYAQTEPEYKLCQASSEFAKTVMQGRQNGISMVNMVNAIKSDNKIQNDFMLSFIIEAYNCPRFQTEEIKQRVIEEFANACYLECIEALVK